MLKDEIAVLMVMGMKVPIMMMTTMMMIRLKDGDCCRDNRAADNIVNDDLKDEDCDDDGNCNVKDNGLNCNNNDSNV